MSDYDVYLRNIFGVIPCPHGVYMGVCPGCTKNQVESIREGLMYRV